MDINQLLKSNSFNKNRNGEIQTIYCGSKIIEIFGEFDKLVRKTKQTKIKRREWKLRLVSQS